MFRYYKNYFYNSLTVKETKQLKIVKFSIEKDMHGFITLHQQDARFFDESYTYSYFRVTIGQVVDERIEYVASKLDCKRNLVFENMLLKGDYIMLIEPFLYTSNTITFTVSSYCSSFVFFSEEEKVDKRDYDRIELLIWKDFCLKNSSLLNDKHTVKIIDTDFEMLVK